MRFLRSIFQNKNVQIVLSLLLIISLLGFSSALFSAPGEKVTGAGSEILDTDTTVNPEASLAVSVSGRYYAAKKIGVIDSSMSSLRYEGSELIAEALGTGNDSKVHLYVTDEEYSPFYSGHVKDKGMVVDFYISPGSTGFVPDFDLAMVTYDDNIGMGWPENAVELYMFENLHITGNSDGTFNAIYDDVQNVSYEGITYDASPANLKKLHVTYVIRGFVCDDQTDFSAYCELYLNGVRVMSEWVNLYHACTPRADCLFYAGIDIKNISGTGSIVVTDYTKFEYGDISYADCINDNNELILSSIPDSKNDPYIDLFIRK